MVKIFVLLCSLAEADRAWIESAVESWRVVSRDALHLRDVRTPKLILFDKHCTWSGSEIGTPHNGAIKLPDGATMPPEVTSYATTHEGQPYLVMALPSIWRASPRHASNTDLDTMTRRVFLHEMTHTAQAHNLGERVGEIVTRYKMDHSALDDDVVQKKFGTDEALVAAIKREIELFYDAARATNANDRRDKLSTALAAMRDRRAKFLSGDNARYAELEDTFLFMEGAANWTMFRDATRTMSRDEAIERVRGSRRWWTQDEGLGVFLAVDAALPGWQTLAFSDDPPTLEGLIERAIAHIPSRN